MKAVNKIDSVVKDDLCTGCGTCVAVCPLSAISMVMDTTRGIYIPRIDEGTCNDCGLCFEVCPGHSVEFEHLNELFLDEKRTDKILGSYHKCYTGSSTDSNLRYNAASGGLVTGMLIYALEQKMVNGALVTRMKKDAPLEPEPFIVGTVDEIISAQKSKYCPVPANIALKEILEKDGKYAVVGLPCHIHGIRKAEELNSTLKERIVLHIGIFCGRQPNFLATDFLLWQNNIARDDVTGIEYRGEGWPGGISIYLQHGDKVFIPHFEAWKSLDLTFFPRRCALCCDGAAELADISFGDAWLPEFDSDKEGTSVIITRTRQAEDVLKKMVAAGNIVLNETTAEKVAESQQDFRGKKNTIRLYIMHARLMSKKIPFYDVTPGRVEFRDCIDASLRLAGLSLASRRTLWRFIPPLYEKLIPFLGRIKRLFSFQWIRNG